MNENRLVIKKRFPCSPERLWQAFTDPKDIAMWYGPEGFTTEIKKMEIREGGEYQLVMRSPKGDLHPLRGKFLKLESPKKLVAIWQWETEDAVMGTETILTIEIAGEKNSSELTLTHDLKNLESKKLHDVGWNSSLEKLEKIIS